MRIFNSFAIAIALLAIAITANAEKNSPLEELKRLANQAEQAHREKDYEKSAKLYHAVLALNPPNSVLGDLFYAIACNEALLAKNALAIKSLTQAVRHGFSDWEQFAADTELVSLRALPEFHRLLTQMKTEGLKHRIFVVKKWDNPDLG